jgi:hypothetical protein
MTCVMLETNTRRLCIHWIENSANRYKCLFVQTNSFQLTGTSVSLYICGVANR